MPGSNEGCDEVLKRLTMTNEEYEREIARLLKEHEARRQDEEFRRRLAEDAKRIFAQQPFKPQPTPTPEPKPTPKTERDPFYAEGDFTWLPGYSEDSDAPVCAAPTIDLDQSVGAYVRSAVGWMVFDGYKVPYVNVPAPWAAGAAEMLAVDHTAGAEPAAFGVAYYDVADKRVFVLASVDGGLDVGALARSLGGNGLERLGFLESSIAVNVHRDKRKAKRMENKIQKGKVPGLSR